MNKHVTQRSYTLDNLLQCHHCDSPMQVRFAKHPDDDIYRCTRSNTSRVNSCASPDIKAGQFENWLLQEIMQVLITPRNISQIQSQLAEGGDDSLRHDPSAIEDLATDPLTYNAKNALRMTKPTLRKFIRRITTQGTQATIDYSIPLPADSPFAGEHIQTIDLPATVIT